MSPPAPAPTGLHYFVQHGLIVIAFNTVLGLGLSLRNGDPAVQMVYAQAIGLSIWVFVDFGRLLFKRDPATNWPAGWRRHVQLVAAVLLGYALGSTIGDAFCGCSTWAALLREPRQKLGYLFLSFACGGGITYFFHSWGRRVQLERLVSTAQRDAAQAQLQLLASQMEPHMLFNTLANLRALIGTDPPRAQAMLDHLVSFLRSTLTGSRNMLHPLSEEFERLADYLALMKIRMGDRLQTRIELPQALGELAVPTLLLQPLVENAIKHGLEPKVEGGRLIVGACSTGPHLELSVRDTGVGLVSAAGDGTHFGLSQVRERLATLYGDEASLTLETPADGDGGALATVRIPLNRTA